MEAYEALAGLMEALRRGRRENALEQAVHYWIDRPAYEPVMRKHWAPVRRVLVALRAADAVLDEMRESAPALGNEARASEAHEACQPGDRVGDRAEGRAEQGQDDAQAEQSGSDE